MSSQQHAPDLAKAEAIDRPASVRPVPMPSTYPPESYVRARRSPPGRDELVQRILTRAYERPADVWSDAVALVEPLAPLRPVDDSEPEPCGKRENYRTAARGLRARRAHA